MSYNTYFGASGGSTTVRRRLVPDMTTVIQWESEGDNVRQYQQRLVELELSEQQICDREIQPEDRGGDEGLPDDERLEGGRRGGPQSLKLIYSGDALDANGVRVGDKLSSASDTVTVSDVLTASMKRRTGAAGAEPIGGTGVPVRLFYKRRLRRGDGAGRSAVSAGERADGGRRGGQRHAVAAVRQQRGDGAQVARASADNSERQSAEYA